MTKPDRHPRVAPPPPPTELVSRPAPVDQELVAYVAAGDHRGLCEFAEGLGHRRDELWARAQELAVQEEEIARLVEGPVRLHPPAAAVVPAGAVAACLADLVAETGDDIATVGIALDVPPTWVRGILTGEITEVPPAYVERMCFALESSPRSCLGSSASHCTATPR
ncbi:MAG: hypothetical protein M3P53_04680 [Actinomycetota bacterium]|nr:hypothetical protein [Actinomycetota bacterium]